MTQIAVVVGSNGPRWNKRLSYAVDDAIKLGRCLRECCKYQVHLLPDGCDSHVAMREIARICAACKPDDDLIIYFSGHGELVRGHLYLMLDETSEAIYDSAIWSKDITHAMELSFAQNKLLILDCCHAGGGVGFKGGNLNSGILESGAQMVLCASKRIERALELPDLKASFLAHHLTAILEHKSRPFVSLREIETELEVQAKNYNISNRGVSVPIPYLFGEHKTFYVKRPSGSPDVELRFRSLFEPDMDLLCSTLKSYSNWTPANISRKLPVRVVLPDEFQDRIEIMSDYLVTDQWPCEVTWETKDQFREFTKKRIPDFVADLTRVIRMVTAASISKDGSSNYQARDCILESYISSKSFATLRLFESMQLNDEPELAWLGSFPDLEAIWSNSLIDGLTWTTQQYTHFNFWTDADWFFMDGTHARIFIPRKLDCGWGGLGQYSRQDYWAIFIPQILESDGVRGYDSLHALLGVSEEPYIRGVVVRGECFINTETHNSRANSYDAKLRVTRIVAHAIAEEIKAQPISEREGMLLELSAAGGMLDNLSEKVRAILSISDAGS